MCVCVVWRYLFVHTYMYIYIYPHSLQADCCCVSNAADQMMNDVPSIGVDLDGFKGMSPGNELDKCIGDLRKKVTEDI